VIDRLTEQVAAKPGQHAYLPLKKLVDWS